MKTKKKKIKRIKKVGGSNLNENNESMDYSNNNTPLLNSDIMNDIYRRLGNIETNTEDIIKLLNQILTPNKVSASNFIP